MGKGSRNRQNHYQERMDNPEKFKQKKQMPKWLTSAIALVLVAAVLVGIVAYIIVSNGIIKRGRVLVESTTGKFDVDQQMATFIAWQTQYYNAYYYYLYCQAGMMTDTYGITSTYSSGDQYALVAAQTTIQNQLRDSVDEVLTNLVGYVAVADKAWEEGIRLDDEDKKTVEDGIEQLETMQTSYGYLSLNDFLDATVSGGMKKSDVKNALELIAMYNKYCTIKQVELESAVTLKDLEAYRDANPESFYKIDYLTYAAEDKAFAEKLAACKTAQEFKDAILEKVFEDNYEDIYNQKTTHKDAAALLDKISNKKDTDNGTALTDALNEIEAKTEVYTKDQEGLDEDLSAWLFDSKRAEQDTASVVTETGIYVIALMSKDADADKVTARYVFVPFITGDATNSFGEGEDKDTEFKNNIHKYLVEYKKDEPEYPSVDYTEAKKQADDFKIVLEKDGADVAKLLEEKKAVKVTGVTSSTATTSLPKVVRDAATKSGVKEENVLTANDGNIYYVIYIEAIADGKTNLSYVTFEGDVYYQIIDGLKTALDKVYPADTAASYKSEPEEDTFEAWISELSDKDGFISARKENDAKYFEVKKTENKVETVTYNAYIVVKNEKASASNMLYLDTESVVNGGYLLYTDKEHAAAAEAGKATLEGKKYTDLVNAMSALSSNNTSATTSTAIKAESVTDENLKEWLFSDEREANTSAVFASKDGKGTYVAMFIEKTEAWKASAKSSHVSTELTEWVKELSESYTPSERVLNKLGEPTTTVETTATTTAAVTEAATA